MKFSARFRRFFSRFTSAALKKSFSNRSFLSGGYSVVSTAIVLLIVIVANLLVSALPASVTQIDTTSQKLFSLSDQTLAVLAALKEDVTVYWIVRDGYEDDTLSHLLDRYSAETGKIDIVRRDPDVYPSFVREYTSEVYDNSLVVSSGNRSRYVDYYDIYEYDYSNYYYDYSYDVNFAGENALTGAISYVVSESLPKLYFLSGHGEAELPSSYTSAIQNENYETASLSLLTANEIPSDADALMIFSPQSDLSSEETDLIRSWLSSGGNLYLVTDPPSSGSFENLYALMAEYGVEAQPGIVIEGDTSAYAWNMPHYILPSMSSHEITDPLISGGYYVMLPLAQGLKVSESLPSGVSVSSLLQASSSSFSKAAGYDMQTFEKESGDTDGPFSLAVAVECEAGENKSSRIIWVSCAAIADESADRMVSGGNEDFFMNALGWLCKADETSISIRSKSLSYDRLTVPGGTASALSVVLVGVLPAMFLIAGIRIVLRRKRR